MPARVRLVPFLVPSIPAQFMTTYRDSGVNIEEGEEAVRRFKPLVRATFTPNVLADIGSFGGLFQLDTAGYETPVLVSSVDGVGTKLKVAFLAGRHDTVGQDLVNHCVNDIAVSGAKPLFFLDYFATGSLSADTAADVITGFAVACKENGCALIGGETAEMPDMYAKGEYDLAGTVVGIVDKASLLAGSSVKSGDALVGLPSTGLHTNGYTLARHILLKKFSIEDTPSELGGVTVGDALLAVHRSYLGPIQALYTRKLAAAFAHITGGGIPGSLSRVLPDGLDMHVDYNAWRRPAIFDLMQQLGDVPEDDMRRTFNLGMGLIAVIPADQLDEALDVWRGMGEEPVEIGRVVEGTVK